MTSRTDAAVPDAFAPPPGNPRFPLFDALRAIAALSVVVTHCSGLTGFNANNPLGAVTARLNAGVTIFFVISGFLLYRPFVAARLDGRPSPDPLKYARRRALRIVPAYWLALTSLAIILPNEVHGPFGRDWWAYYGFMSNWRFGTILSGITPAWSLCVEIAFYIALPFVALSVTRWLAARPREQQIRWELGALGLSAAAALVLRAIVFHFDPTTLFPNSLPGCWTWFAAGMAVAVLSAGYHGVPVARRPAPLRLVSEHPTAVWVAAALVLLATSTLFGLPRVFAYRYSNLSFQLEHVLYVLFAVLLVLPAVFGTERASLPRTVLARRELARLGLVSYGIFLYHLPILMAVQHVADRPAGFEIVVVLVTVVATAAATASYVLVEKPLLRFKDGRPGRRGARGAGAPGVSASAPIR